MRSARKAILASTALAALGLAAVAVAGEKGVPLPKDYRSWTHVRSMVVTDPDHGMYGFQDVYANRAALETLRGRSKVFKNGAVLVAAIYEPITEDGMVKAGGKRRIAVKVKDAKATATSGWRYAVYDPAGRPIQIDPANCAGCHQGAKDTDYVFARFVE